MSLGPLCFAQPAQPIATPLGLDDNVEQLPLEETTNPTELLESVFIEFAEPVETRTSTNPTAVIEAGLDENVEQSPLEQTTNPTELLESVFISSLLNQWHDVVI